MVKKVKAQITKCYNYITLISIFMVSQMAEKVKKCHLRDERENMYTNKPK